MLLHRWHFWPNAGHFFFACDVPHLRQVPRDDCCLLFAARDGIDGLLLFERPCFITFTFELAAMSFTWCSICSAALMRSTAFCIVKSLYRSSPSRILSRIPKTILSRKISSGVISSCWQFLAIVLSTVRYAAMFSAGSCLRLLNRYRSYTAISRKFVKSKVHATIPKGNMG